MFNSDFMKTKVDYRTKRLCITLLLLQLLLYFCHANSYASTEECVIFRANPNLFNDIAPPSEYVQNLPLEWEMNLVRCKVMEAYFVGDVVRFSLRVEPQNDGFFIAHLYTDDEVRNESNSLNKEPLFADCYIEMPDCVEAHAWENWKNTDRIWNEKICTVFFNDFEGDNVEIPLRISIHDKNGDLLEEEYSVLSLERGARDEKILFQEDLLLDALHISDIEVDISPIEVVMSFLYEFDDSEYEDRSVSVAAIDEEEIVVGYYGFQYKTLDGPYASATNTDKSIIINNIIRYRINYNYILSLNLLTGEVTIETDGID